MIVLDLDHTEDEDHESQESSFHNHYHHSGRPRFLFEGLWGKFITTVLHTGQKLKGHNYQAGVETPS